MKKNNNEKEYEIENISLDQMAEQIKKERVKILNEFAKAYLAETQINPSELELVQRQESKDGLVETVYYFRRKLDNEQTKT